jgi:hypothetical protein
MKSRAARSEIATCISLGLAFLAGSACGPQAPDSGGTGNDSLQGAETAASNSGAMSGSSVVTADSGGATTGATSASSSDSDGGVHSTGTTGPDAPPGADCPSPPPPVDPPVPDGCVTSWLVDESGAPLVGQPSGLVHCTGPERLDDIYYRTAAVACTSLIGDQCLCDADCPKGEACICANEATTAPGLGVKAGNYCFPADCASADDCAGLMCRVDLGPCSGARFPEAMRCATPGDECLFDSACSGLCDYDEQMEFFACEFGAICE